MSRLVDSLKRTLAELVDERQRLDADIRDLGRIISRHEDAPSADTTTVIDETTGEVRTSRPMRPEDGFDFRTRAAPPGQARQEILDIMSDGAVWAPADIARIRGTSSNAASATLQRMIEEDAPLIARVGFGKYRLLSSTNGSKGSDDNPLLMGSVIREADSEAS